MLRRFILAVLAAVVFASPTRAQSLPDSVIRRVDSVFADYDRTDQPGCVLGVYRDQRIAYARGYGMANLELGIALNPRSVLDIGSTSKQFSAFAIGLLEQDGKLRRTDPVRKHLPELGAYAGAITIEQMIQHTSGLRDYLVLMSLVGYRTEDWTDAGDALRLIARQREANFAPDSEWLYSNTGYFLLAEIVERVSGKTLRAFAAERIFGPLGMRGSHFHDDHAMVVPGRATGYSPKDEGGFGIDMSDFEQTGDGAVLTSVEELLRWDQNFYTGQVGGMDLVRRQQVPGTLASGAPIEYASGLFISKYRGQPTVSHGGAWAGYRAELLRFPDHQTSFAVLCNRGDANPSRRAERVADAVLGGVLEPPAATATGPAGTAVSVPREVLAQRVGIWKGRVTGDVRIIELAGDRLVLKMGRDLPMVPLSADRFSILESYSVRFEMENGKPVLVPEQDVLGKDRFDLVPAFRPGAAELAAFAGDYHAPELDVTWRIVADSAGLRAELRGRELAKLSPTYADHFSSRQGSSLAFRRGKSGRVTGFSVQAGRVRNIFFTRVP
ncbi:MAG TPA: serine hydrolase domain-containing protein [Gemmatimonadales bacterium]